MLRETLQAQLSALKEFFDRSTRVLEEKDSAYTPVTGTFTVSQQMAHAAQTIEWFMDAAFSETGFDMDFARAEKLVRAVTSVNAAREWMDRACEKAKSVIDAHSEAEWAELFPPNPIVGETPKFAMFFSIVDHTAHHRGALTIYSRQLGYVPPMPYMEM